MSDETYKIEVRCKNCDFDGEVEIKKGFAVKDRECPRCELLTLVKKLRGVRMSVKRENYS